MDAEETKAESRLLPPTHASQLSPRALKRYVDVMGYSPRTFDSVDPKFAMDASEGGNGGSLFYGSDEERPKPLMWDDVK